MRRLVRGFIMWMVRSRLYYPNHKARANYPVAIVNWRPNMSPRDDSRQVVARRYAPFLVDEYTTREGKLFSRLPCWAPCNALLHHWRTHRDEQMHDHQRWSVTIVLKGQLTELTPWGDRVLTAGSVVFRSTRYIHGFACAPEHSARTWTLFVVGRRKGVQNTFVVTRRFEVPNRKAD